MNAGSANAGRAYWIFGSVTGTTPGIPLLGVNIPLNFDLYTSFTIANPNVLPLLGFRGGLDASGRASASFVLPGGLVNGSVTLYHAYVVFDSTGRFYCASNSRPLKL